MEILWENELVFLLLSTLITTSAGYFLWWIKKRKEAIPKYFSKSAEIYDILNTLVAEVNADRILILKSHNGGGVPTPKKVLKSSVIYELCGPELDPVKQDWQNQPIDQQYSELISEVISHGLKTYITSNMKRSLLKDVYLSHGIQATIVLPISLTREAFYYLSINYLKEPSTDMIPRYRNAIRIAEGKLQRYFT